MRGAACPEQRLNCVGKGLLPMHVFLLTALDRKKLGDWTVPRHVESSEPEPSSGFPASELPTAPFDCSDVALLSPAGDCSPSGQLFLVDAYRLSGLHFLNNSPNRPCHAGGTDGPAKRWRSIVGNKSPHKTYHETPILAFGGRERSYGPILLRPSSQTRPALA